VCELRVGETGGYFVGQTLVCGGLQSAINLQPAPLIGDYIVRTARNFASPLSMRA
jgi:hypothetical protein